MKVPPLSRVFFPPGGESPDLWQAELVRQTPKILNYCYGQGSSAQMCIWIIPIPDLFLWYKSIASIVMPEHTPNEFWTHAFLEAFIIFGPPELTK